ncbi:MAG: thioredoxin domain-containing protein [Bryobacteraceae bacterium]|nr:thioredoxin domain-containing protein [Bryobacteraceae bacterium]
MPNRLAYEASPYLLQHANNPVDWYPWGEEAFEKARAEDKPIFLSIGYSTCHWCHVMEHESFENDTIAGLLNEHFVPVKVDREERPDVDRIYMMFLQATTGSGGWPMSIFLTPELKPFFGGTYYAPESRPGRPGFGLMLQKLAEAWAGDRAHILDSGEAVLAELRKYSVVRGDGSALDQAALSAKLGEQLSGIFDSKLGGFGAQPKFPRPVIYNFLLRHHHLTGNDEALEMVTKTLDEMARGGIHDQLGGGFHRYSVDAQWFVPHFEKMLYDQAQLAVSYLEAYQITRETRYANVARGILDYVLREMTSPEGGFYSAEDADSEDPAKPGQQREGAFFVWTYDEIANVIGERAMTWFAYRYGCVPNGNVHHDPQQEFARQNILYESRTVQETAQRFGLPVSEMNAALEEAKVKLMASRGARTRPGLDDKVLTSWNGMMISAFAKGAMVLDEARYLTAAQRGIAFLRQHLITHDGVLLRRFRQGEAAIPGFLDDYVFFAQALLDVHQADFDPRHLALARTLVEDFVDLFDDEFHGGFYTTTGADPDLILRVKDDYDASEPSGNSAAAGVLVQMHAITGEAPYLATAERLFGAFAPRLTEAPHTLPQMMVALLAARTPHRQVVFAGPYDAELVRLARRDFAPFQTVLRAEWTQVAMPPLDGKPTAYVCQNFACQLPVTDAEGLATQLQAGFKAS